MFVNIKEDVLKEFLSRHSLEAVFLDRFNNELKRVFVTDFVTSLYLDSPKSPTYNACHSTVEFRRENASAKIERLGVVTMDYKIV